jgi:hypothetical protein
MSAAKAFVGAILAFLALVAAQLGVELSVVIEAILAAIVTGVTVYATPNRPYPPRQ